MIEKWNSYNQVNENITKARSVLRKLEIPETNEDFIQLRKMLTRNAGYLGKFTHWLFVDGVKIDQLQNLYDRIRGTRLSKPIDDFKTPEEVIDTIIRSRSDAALNQMIGAIPSETRSFLKSGYCDTCDGENLIDCEFCNGDGSIDCEDCEGEGSIECKKCEGEGCKKCEDRGSIECKKCEEGTLECKDCKGIGTTECKDCKDGTKEWKKFLDFLRLHSDKKELIIDFLSKKGGRYGDYDYEEAIDYVKRDIEKLLNIPSIEEIKRRAISKEKVKSEQEDWNPKTREIKKVINEVDGIRFLYDDDKYLIIACNWYGLQEYGSSYWCITEDEDTFNQYVYEDSICIQTVLFIKGKSPLSDDRSVIGITYDLLLDRITAAHWEDDEDAVGDADKIFKDIKFKEVTNKHLFSSLDIYEHEGSDELLFLYPDKFSDKIKKEIEECKDDLKNSKTNYTISNMISSYYEYCIDNDITDYKFIKYLLSNINFKFPIHERELGPVIDFDLTEHVIFNKNWLKLDIFAYLEDLEESKMIKVVKLFRDNGYKFRNINNSGSTSYIKICIKEGIIDISNVYKSLDYKVIYNDSEIKDDVFDWVLNNDFKFAIGGDYSNLFIKWIVSKNKVDKYRKSIINILERGISKSSTEFIIDEIDDDEIEIMATKSLIHSRLKKKWQIDFKKFEKIKSFKDFKRFNS
jgi:hypothetical protein